MKLAMIAAIDRNRVMGRADGSLPWKNPEEMAWFKEATAGALVIMGRTTFESLGSRGLKGRHNVILSSRFAKDFPNLEGWKQDLSDRERPVTWVHSVRGAILTAQANAQAGTPCFVIGGARTYKELFPHCSSLFLSHLDLEVASQPGDVLFPELPPSWVLSGNFQRGESFLVEHWRQKPWKESPPLTTERKEANWSAICSGRDLLHELEEAKRDVLRASRVETVVHPRLQPGNHGFTAGDTLDW